jgi:hypothetical protein
VFSKYKTNQMTVVLRSYESPININMHLKYDSGLGSGLGFAW